MSEWVKAIVNPVHERDKIKTDALRSEWLKKQVIRVRVHPPAKDGRIIHRRCDPKFWYEVHPEDALKIFPDFRADRINLICDHEIRLVT